MDRDLWTEDLKGHSTETYDDDGWTDTLQTEDIARCWAGEDRQTDGEHRQRKINTDLILRARRLSK